MAKFVFRTDPQQAGSAYRAGELPAGPYIAEIMAVGDPTKNNRVAVALLDQANAISKEDPSTWIDVTIALPHYGITPYQSGNSGRSKEQFDAGTSYGLTISEPDIGTNCLVVFANGSREAGYIISFIPNAFQNTTSTGRGVARKKQEIAWKDKDKEEWFNTGVEFPVMEKNLKATKTASVEAIEKLRYAFDGLMTKILYAQGLLFDAVRGTTSSSSARQAPKGIIGMSSKGRPIPDPADDSALLEKWKTQPQGLSSSELDVLQRKPGHSFTLDDGEIGGENNLIRLRSGKGAQILLNDEKGLIYITNQAGTSWIEMTKSGKIDIFAGDSLSVHTSGDFNLQADRDINMSAGGDFNVGVGASAIIHSGLSVNLTAGTTLKTNANDSTTINSGTFIANYAGSNFTAVAQTTSDIVAKGNLSLHSKGHVGIESDGNNVLMKGAQVHMNSAGNPPPAHSVAQPLQAKTSIPPARVPQHEPWDQHEDLDPEGFTLKKTKAGTEQQGVYLNSNGILQYSNDPANQTGPQ
jgi:hypothetical protein